MTEELDVDKSARDPDKAVEIALQPAPISLSTDEINAKADPVKPANGRDGIAVHAWVHFATSQGPRSVRLRCMVTAYNSRAVQVEGRIGIYPWRAWLWANAVTRVGSPK
ncbi:hypothetical protein [Gryllotalpicola protaetiae]|uniref:Uncharacterized protein n=1 Tax=Gryllotalpicola protaetiae TaxID=2419771 RepID=A0A387BI47_9MICO|nr:hypothetical protein [Gryllotalpicola protaetiae]AYG02358.1 hypothetical protein D7I44_01630 [Gryllotalpicola protaetiae]